MRRLLVLVAAVAAACSTAPGVAAAQSTVDVQMTGAGTVELEVASGTPAKTETCPPHPRLNAPDTGDPYLACSGTWQPVCTPASGSPSCLVRLRATPKVPGAPDLDSTELGGWRALAWAAGPCAGATGSCLVTIGTCTAPTACTYTDAVLGAAFDDVRDPTALVLQGPPPLVTDPNGVATFLLGSNEYKQQETSRLTCLFDGTVLASCRRRPEFAVLTGVADGAHTLEVRATDPSGRTGPATTYRWTQAYPPVVTFDARPAAGSVVPTPDATFAFHADREATYTCRLDGGEREECDESYDAAGLADGHHRLEITAKRTDVDVSSTVTTDWRVDTAAPTSAITGGPDGDTKARSATFTFALTQAEEGARFECALDGLSFEPCGGASVTYERLAPGPHTFQVRGIDAAGNREDPPQEAAWTVIVDDDGDGASPPDDCDDANAAVSPFAVDTPGNGVDEDCDGVDGFDDGGFGTDADGDGDPAFPEGTDCDDANPDANAFGFEVPENGVDEDCDGTDAVLPGAAVRFEARWKVTRTGARLVAFRALKVPAGTQLRLEVSCPKQACRRRVKRITVEEARKPMGLLRYLPRLGTLPRGAVLEARAFRAGRHPEGQSWTVRADKPPRTAEFCVRRGKTEPGRC